MKHLLSTKSRLASTLFLTIGLVMVVLALFTPRSGSQTPALGTLNPGGPNVIWNGNAPGLPPSEEGETTCVEDANCETFKLTLSGTPANWLGKKARVVISWADAGNDYDVYIHKGTATGPIVGSSAAGGAGPETVELDPSIPTVGTGDFFVHVVYWLVIPDQYHAVASAIGGVPTPTPTPTGTPTPTPPPPGTPRYFNYYAPPGVAEDAGEPTIGSNWNTELSFSNNNIVTGLPNTPIPNGGTANYYGGFLSFMLRVKFNDCSSPAIAPFEQMPVTLPATTRVFGDPILFTDQLTGRTFVCQLEGLTPAGSTIEFTDNDGNTFSPSQGAGPSCIDHETIGGGAFHAPVPPGLLYPNAVYYASQCVTDATSELSLDGGITFPIQTVMFTAADCAGLHGHLKVAPDGTVYVPDKACAPLGVPFVLGGKAAVAVSENNGLTWDVRTMANGSDTDAGNDDPSVGVSWCPPAPFACNKAARSNTIYLGYQTGGDHRPEIAKSTDRGLTWSTPVDVGAQVGVKSIAFPEVAVGDPDRAAFAFFGTTTAGDGTQPAFPGVWHLYVATTFDGGATWKTVNATPNDPIQRGGICGDGTCRNLLDFFDITIDKEGRILIAGEDGCIGGCVNGGPNSFTAKAFITRQSGGKRMFSVFDPVEPARPGAPLVSGNVDAANAVATLEWPVPDNGGANITSYKVYRSPNQAGPYALLATVAQPGYVDAGFAGGKFYRITAVNSVGEGPYCKDFKPVGIELPDPCELPGVLVSNDLNPNGSDNDPVGANMPVDQRVNAKQLYIAEPFVGGGVEQFFFTLFVGPSTAGSAPPNSQWFIVWNRQTPDANHDRWYTAMRTDAAGTPSFEYGKFGVPLDPTNPNQNANTPQFIGAADAGSFYDPLTGVIRIKLLKSKAENVPPGNDLAGVNVRTYFNRPDPGQRSQNNASDITADGSYSVVGNASCAPAADLVKAVSRKTHGPAGPFDLKLFPLVPAGNTAIECRKGGGAAANTHKVVFTFEAPVTFTSASTTPAAGKTAQVDSTSPPGVPSSEVTVNLKNVSDEQTLAVNLLGVSTGGASSTVSVLWSVLAGDTSSDKRVNVTDTNQTKSKSGQLTENDNFRHDVSLDGRINVTDTNFVKSHSGGSIP